VGIAYQGGVGDWQNLSNRCRLRRAAAPLTFRSPLNIGWRLSDINAEQKLKLAALLATIERLGF